MDTGGTGGTENTHGGTATARDTGRTSGDEGLAGRFVPRAANFPQRKISPSPLTGRHCL